MTVYDLTYRNREPADQNIFLGDTHLGHVTYTGDGWKAYDRDGEQVGWSEAKSDAAQMLARWEVETDD